MKKAGLYIHIPFCKKKCNYCDFFSVKHHKFEDILSDSGGSIFARRIVKDVSYMKQKYKIDEWDSIYVGGGTPSSLSCSDMEFIFSSILKGQKTKPVEFTVEINPEDLTVDILTTLYSVDVNRISMGMQSFSDDVLKKANRRGSGKKNIEALKLVKEFNTGTISCDLIAGLAGQDERIIKQDIETLLDFLPEHISFYSLCTHKELSNEEQDNIDNLWLLGNEILLKHNYTAYEVSNFAYKDKYKSIHNQKYWKLQDYIGVGPGACGSIFYDRNKDVPAYSSRFMAKTDIFKWLYSNERDSVYAYEKIEEEELIEEFIMMGLRLSEGFDIRDFQKRFNKDIEILIQSSLEKWKKSKLLEMDENKIKLTSRGQMFLNSFLEDVFYELSNNQ